MAPEASQDATEAKPSTKNFTSKEVSIEPTKEKSFKVEIRKLSYYKRAPEQKLSHSLRRAVNNSRDGYYKLCI